jgi:hypothetical protein
VLGFKVVQLKSGSEGTRSHQYKRALVGVKVAQYLQLSWPCQGFFLEKKQKHTSAGIR